VAREPKLIIQVPRGGAVDRQLDADPPAAVADGDIVVTGLGAGGEVVLSVPSPETLTREADEVRQVLGRAGTGVEPLIVVVEAAEELRDDELAAVVDAAQHAPRAVILRVLRDG
jgi:hypothetical protein